MNCDMCGKESKLFPTSIENSTLNVCSSCSKYGTIKKQKILDKRIDEIPETTEVLSENFNSEIRHARESKNLKQKELASKISIKESLLHNIESGKHKPDDILIKKFENFLNIHLTEKVKEEKIISKESSKLTIGDLIKKS